MCGISGFWGNFPQGLLERMNRALAHRGPDDEGILFVPEKGIGLAHRRLSIIDLSEDGHQPMWSSNGRAAVVFNGEIYNYPSLRSELISDGFTFNSRSDTEVLLNLYLRDGVDFISQLNGMFAFALWDKDENALLLARDGVGIKPLYYAETGKGLLFASELKALLLEPSLRREIDFVSLDNYLRYLWCPAPRTPLKGVKKLEPGHALFIRNAAIEKKWRFYDLPYEQEIAPLSVRDAADAVTKTLKQAVQRQMIADVEVGAFLSGGLDSSSIVAFAREHARNRKLQCFTIGFKDDAWAREGIADDLAYAQQVAGHLDVDLHTIYVGPEMTDQLENMLYHLDEPQADPAPLNALFISQLARKNGIKVLLSGAGGDDIFSGYRRHQALLLERYWNWLPKGVRRSMKNATQGLPKTTTLGRRLAKAFQYADWDGDARIASYFNWNTPNALQALYSDHFKNGLQKRETANPLCATLNNLPGDVPPLNRMLYLEGKHFLADHNLNYTDKMSMAAGMEVRVPLLDPDLIALAARLPVHYKQHGREGKWIFKKAMEPYLPRNVIYRPKTGFGAPLRGWLRNELKPVVEEVLSDNSLANRGLFEPKSVNALRENDKTGRIDGTYTIFSLMCIEMWCRIFIDRKSPDNG